MKKSLKVLLITISVLTVCIVGYFSFIQPLFLNTNNTNNNDLINTPSEDNQDTSDTNDDNKEENTNDDNTNTDNDDNTNDDKDNSNNDNDTNDDNVDNSVNTDDENKDNTDDEEKDDENKENEENPDGGDDQLEKIYTVKILDGATLVYSATTKNEIFSSSKNGEFKTYTLVIESNYELGAITSSENVVVLNETVEGFNIKIEFNILNGNAFSFIIDNETISIDCTQFKQYSYLIEIPKGQSGISLNGNTITLTQTKEIMFQIIIFEDNIHMGCTISCDELNLQSFYGAYYTELTSSVSAKFKVVEYDYEFVINFVLV